MVESQQPIHTEATLLPAYVTRTLSPDEREQVERHLPTCPACQQELQDSRTMQAALDTAIQQRPGPSAAAFANVMRQIRGESQPASTNIGRESELSWWQTIEKAVRSLFHIPWVPVLATVLIFGQAVLLLAVLGEPERQMDPGPVIERGIPQGTPARPPIHIQVKFVETTREVHIRQLIRDLNGQIVSGPTQEGEYTLAFTPKEQHSLQSILSDLRMHPDVIKTVTVPLP